MSEIITVTSKWLREHNACPEQVDIFVQEWGESVTVTRAVLARATALELDLDWWLERARPGLRAEYERQVAPLLAEYERQVAEAPLRPKYTRQRDWLCKYTRQRARLWLKHKRQVAGLVADLLELPGDV